LNRTGDPIEEACLTDIFGWSKKFRMFWDTTTTHADGSQVLHSAILSEYYYCYVNGNVEIGAEWQPREVFK
jgi:hypothetical protein